jgi:hypothetical protein
MHARRFSRRSPASNSQQLLPTAAPTYLLLPAFFLFLYPFLRRPSQGPIRRFFRFLSQAIIWAFFWFFSGAQ